MVMSSSKQPQCQGSASNVLGVPQTAGRSADLPCGLTVSAPTSILDANLAPASVFSAWRQGCKRANSQSPPPASVPSRQRARSPLRPQHLKDDSSSSDDSDSDAASSLSEALDLLSEAVETGPKPGAPLRIFCDGLASSKLTAPPPQPAATPPLPQSDSAPSACAEPAITAVPDGATSAAPAPTEQPPPAAPDAQGWDEWPQSAITAVPDDTTSAAPAPGEQPPPAAPEAEERDERPQSNQRKATTTSPSCHHDPSSAKGPPKAGKVLLVDPLGHWRNREVHLLLAIRDSIPGVEVRALRQAPEGPLLTVSDVEAFKAGAADADILQDVMATTPRPPPRQLEVALNVPASIPAADILADLQAQHGPQVRAVRRLHASTEGRVDRERPLPRVIVAVTGEETAALVRRSRLFGVLSASASTAKEVPLVVQCLRCFKLGHRAAACSSRRHCIRCNSTDHLAPQCSTSRENTRCLGCDGPHAVTWRGCPLRLKAIREARQRHAASQPSQPKPKSARAAGTAPPAPRAFQARKVTAKGPSFAQLAALNTDQAALTTEAPPSDDPTMEVDAPMAFPPLAAPTKVQQQQQQRQQAQRQEPLPVALQQPSTVLSRTAEMRLVAEQLREANSRLDEATRRQRDATLEWECLRTPTAKRAKARESRRCRKLRKRIRDLLERQASVRAAHNTASTPTFISTPSAMTLSAGGATLYTTTYANNVSCPAKDATTPSGPQPTGALSSGAGQPGPSPPAGDAHCLLAQVLKGLRVLARTSTDPVAALAAMDSVLAALEGLFQPSSLRYV